MNFDNLNENQREAVLSIKGPVLIIAGPGSGKTRTLVERISYMLEEKRIPPEKILVTTFTEKAARELITRVYNRIEDKSINLNELYIGTIHSVCLKIIDEFIDKTDLYQGYEILDDINQKFFIYKKFKEFKELEEYDSFFQGRFLPNNWKKAKFLQKWFNRFSEEGESIEKIKEKNQFLGEAYEKYIKLLKNNNILDFGNIQRTALNILENNSEVLVKLREQLSYIMIDEYQDTNEIQEKIIFTLAGENGNLCVVGDDDQGIYRFRGATIRNILQFKERYSDQCKVIKLSINYRSPSHIVNFCKEWIESLKWDEFRYEKEIEAFGDKKNDKIAVVKLSVKNSEIQWMDRIYKFINYLKNKEIIEDYNQIAFLFRSVRNKKVINLGHYLEGKGIKVYSPRSNLFFYREEVRVVLGIYLRIFPNVEENIFNSSLGIDIRDYYISANNKVEKMEKSYKDLKSWIKKKKKYYEEDFKGKESLLSIFYEIISLEYFQNIFNKTGINVVENRESYNLGIFSKILKDFEILSKVEILTKENLERVIGYLFNNHLKFLKESGIDEYEDSKEQSPKGAISFLTIHQSKGLEFPVVVIGSLEGTPIKKENILDGDLEKAFENKTSYEPLYRTDEFDFWRLFYTGFSRAKNLLILSCNENEKLKNPVPSLPFKRLYDQLPDIASGKLDFNSLNLDKVEESNLKEVYTYTGDIGLYRRCPFKYKMNKIFKMETSSGIGLIYGRLVHETIEKLHIEILEKGVENIIEEDIFKIYYKIYFTLKESTNISLGKTQLNKGLNQVNEYFIREKNMLNLLKYVEEKISTVEAYGILEGTLDMVLDNGDSLEIVDFKTGDVPSEEEYLESYKKQLQFYSYILEKKKKKSVTKGILYFIKTGEKIEVDFHKEIIEKNIEESKEIILNINSKNFEEKIYNKEKCKNCEFFHYCTVNV